MAVKDLLITPTIYKYPELSFQKFRERLQSRSRNIYLWREKIINYEHN